MNGGDAHVRFSRDKRGYEHYCLVHQPSQGRRGKPRPHVLYWFRTPPNIKVGRTPFDDEARRTIEARHPHVSFDWKKLADTPIPPPTVDVERWRERRRLERAAKQAIAAEARAAEEDDEAERAGTDLAEVPLAESVEPPSAGGGGPDDTVALATPAGGVEPPVEGAPPPSGRRRRRRRRRGGHRLGITAAPPSPETGDPAAALAATSEGRTEEVADGGREDDDEAV